MRIWPACVYGHEGLSAARRGGAAEHLTAQERGAAAYLKPSRRRTSPAALQRTSRPGDPVLLLAEVLLAEVLAPLLLQSTAADAVHLTVSADRAD